MISESVFPLLGKPRDVEHVSRSKGSQDMSRNSKNSNERGNESSQYTYWAKAQIHRK